MNLRNTQQYFDRAALSYQEKGRRGLWAWLRKRESAAVLRLIGNEPLGDVLELGCGAGFYSHLLARRALSSLTCVDFSESMLAKISSLACRKICQDITTFQSKQTYDLIACLGALEFTTSPKRVLMNVSQMLKSTGRFVILVPKKSLSGFFYYLFHRWQGNRIMLFTRHQLTQWASEVGLCIRDSHSVFPFTWVVQLGKNHQP